MINVVMGEQEAEGLLELLFSGVSVGTVAELKLDALYGQLRQHLPAPDKREFISIARLNRVPEPQ